MVSNGAYAIPFLSTLLYTHTYVLPSYMAIRMKEEKKLAEFMFNENHRFLACRRFDYDQMMLEHTQILVPYCIYLVNQFKQRLVIKKHFNCNRTIQLQLQISQNLTSPRWHEISNFILLHLEQTKLDLLHMDKIHNLQCI